MTGRLRKRRTTGRKGTVPRPGKPFPSPIHVPQSVLQQISEHLGRYVYLLIDPRDGVPFYVGKGRGVRMAAHGIEAEVVASDPAAVSAPKVERINAIRRAGLEPETWVLRYGLREDYTEVEAAAIDLLKTFPVQRSGLRRVPLVDGFELTNQRREAATGAGLLPLSALFAEFAAPDLTTQQPLLLITLKPWVDMVEPTPGGTQRQGFGFKQEWVHQRTRLEGIKDLADSTRCWWRVDQQKVERLHIAHAVAVYRGVTRALFEIVPGSWENRDVGPNRMVRRGFRVEPVLQGHVYDEVLGPDGHRCPPKVRGDQSPLNYWPRG